MLQQTISAIRPQTWEAVNRAVLASAKQDKLESGATVRFQPAAWGPLAEAMRLLGVPDNFTREDIIAAFNRAVLASAKQDKLESGATVRFQPAAWGPLAEAMRLLGVPDNFTREDIIAAFKREVKKAHPDVGGGFR